MTPNTEIFHPFRRKQAFSGVGFARGFLASSRGCSALIFARRSPKIRHLDDSAGHCSGPYGRGQCH